MINTTTYLGAAAGRLFFVAILAETAAGRVFFVAILAETAISHA